MDGGHGDEMMDNDESAVLFATLRHMLNGPMTAVEVERIVACVKACRGMDDPEKSVAALQGLWYSHFPSPPCSERTVEVVVEGEPNAT